MKAKITKTGYKAKDKMGRKMKFTDIPFEFGTTYTYDFWNLCLAMYDLDYSNPVTITIEGATTGPIVLKSKNNDE